MDASEAFIQMSRIQIAGQRGKQLNVPRFQGAGQTCLFAQGYFGESAIANRISVNGRLSPYGWCADEFLWSAEVNRSLQPGLTVIADPQIF